MEMTCKIFCYETSQKRSRKTLTLFSLSRTLLLLSHALPNQNKSKSSLSLCHSPSLIATVDSCAHSVTVLQWKRLVCFRRTHLCRSKSFEECYKVVSVGLNK